MSEPKIQEFSTVAVIAGKTWDVNQGGANGTLDALFTFGVDMSGHDMHAVKFVLPRATRFLIDGRIRDAVFALTWLAQAAPVHGLNTFIVLGDEAEPGDEASTLEEYIRAEHDADEIREMAENGVEHYGGYMMYRDTNILYERFEDDIWGILYDEAENLGSEGSVLGMLSQASVEPATDAQFRNLAVQWAASSIVRRLADESEKVLCDICGDAFDEDDIEETEDEETGATIHVCWWCVQDTDTPDDAEASPGDPDE